MNSSVNLIEAYLNKVSYPLNEDETCSGECRFVYLLHNPLTKLSKIGISGQPIQRMKQLRTQNGVELYDLLLLELQPDYDENSFYIEQFVHEYFNDKRRIGEWFEFSDREFISIRNLFYEIGGDMMWDNIKYFLCPSSRQYKENNYFGVLKGKRL
tara:strand:- start:94 stop:558 length:465 start_codon:yes stop_codon:yes gene_type:complete